VFDEDEILNISDYERQEDLHQVVPGKPKPEEELQISGFVPTRLRPYEDMTGIDKDVVAMFADTFDFVWMTDDLQALTVAGWLAWLESCGSLAGRNDEKELPFADGLIRGSTLWE